jgi:Na+-driven multidrug efflux pump
MFSMLFIGVGIFNILYFIGQFGDLATAGYGAALRVEQVFLLPVIGLNTAVLSIGGQNFGAKEYDRIRELYTKALLFGSSFMAMTGLILFFGAEFFVSQFTDNQEAIIHGTIYLKVAALISPVYPVFFITTAEFQDVARSQNRPIKYKKLKIQTPINNMLNITGTDCLVNGFKYSNFGIKHFNFKYSLILH